MTFPVRVAVQIQPADTPDYATWRQAVLHAEEIGVDVIFGYDHFHAPFIESIADAKPVLAEVHGPPRESFAQRAGACCQVQTC